MAITANVHLTSCNWFGTILPKKAWIILCKTSLDPIWMAWSGFFPNTSGPGASQCARTIGPCSGRMQLPAITYQFPTFRLSCILPQMAWIRLRNASQDLFWFWLSAFGQMDPVIKARWCARIIEPASGKHLWANRDQMWIGSGMFTGKRPVLFTDLYFGHLSIQDFSVIKKKEKKKRKGVEIDLNHSSAQRRDIYSKLLSNITYGNNHKYSRRSCWCICNKGSCQSQTLHPMFSYWADRCTNTHFVLNLDLDF